MVSLVVHDIDQLSKQAMREILDVSIDYPHEVIIDVIDRINDTDQRMIIEYCEGIFQWQ